MHKSQPLAKRTHVVRHVLALAMTMRNLGIGRATVAHVGTILVVVKPTWVGYSDGERPRDLMSCSSVSGVKCECRVVL